MRQQDRKRGTVVCYCLLVWVSVTFTGCYCQDNQKKVCLGGKEDSPPVDVTLSCGADKVISLGEVLLGRNVYGLCTYVSGDCLDATDVLNKCEGQENCTITLDKAYSPECGYATFLKVSYDCLAVATRPVIPPTTRPDSDVPRNTDYGQRTDSEGENSEEDNTALIAGSVVAVTITIILLIVAIVLVVRRLACAEEIGDEEEEKKSSGCRVLPCVALQSAEDETKNGHSAVGPDASPDDKRAKRKRKHRSRRADKNQNMSARLAPVGQEDEEEGTSSTATEPARTRSKSSLNEGAASLMTETSAAKEAGDTGRGGAPATGGVDQGAQEKVVKSKRLVKETEGTKEALPADITEGTRVKNKTAAKPAAAEVASVSAAAATAPKQPKPFDAVAVPNTETTTSC